MFGFGACGKPGEGHQGSCSSKAAILKELKLNDNQLERVAELKLEGLGQCAQLKATLGQHVKSLAHELTQETINKSKVSEIMHHFKAEKEKIADSMIERIITFAEVLTPEQRKKLRITAIKKFLGFDFAEGEA